MASADEPAALLASIREQRANNPLSILTLAEPILAEQSNVNTTTDSDADQDASTQRTPSNPTEADNNKDAGGAAGFNLSPQTLSADLAHYRELFSKLRFSYLEQVTKEKYLRAIVGDPPVLVSHDENIVLEDRLTAMKATLKAKKEDNDRLVTDLEVLAGTLAERYELVTQQLGDLERLPVEIETLEEQVASITAEVERKEAEAEAEDEDEMDENGNDEMDVDIQDSNVERDVVDVGRSSSRKRKRDKHPHDPATMNMSLEDTEAEIERQRQEMKEVDEQIAALQASLPAKMRECETVEKELEVLEGTRNTVTRAVREMQKLREQGGRDPLEERARWLKAEETVLRGLLGVEVAVET